MGKRPKEETEEEVAAAELAAKKAAKKAKKAAAAAAAAEEEEAEDPEAVALAAKKAAKKAKKAAAAAVEEEEEDPEAAKKAAKKAKKAAAAAAAAEEEEAEKPAKTVAPKKEEAVSKPADDDESFKDNTYKCCDCGEDWVDTADDQQFRWDKGFAETPKRCKDCRWAKKVRMEGGDPEAKGKSKGKKGKSGDNALTVFVRGLPFSTTEDVLQKDFAECGEIVSCRMPLNDDGNCKGIAFIAYVDKEGMDKAVAFNETDYGGRTIYCVPAADKPEGKGKGKDGKDKGKGKGKGKKGKAPSEAFAKSSGAIVESTGKKQTFADSDDE